MGLTLLALAGPARAAPKSWPVRFRAMPSVPTGADSAPVGLGLAHVYGNGPDLVVADAVRGLIVLANDGTGRFQEGTVLPAGNSATCVSAGRMAAGPGESLAAANMLDSFFTVFMPTGRGTFEREDVPVATYPQSVAMVNVAGDGLSTLVVGLAGRLSQLALFRRIQSRWTETGEIDLPWTPMGVIPAQLQPGGPLEVIVSPSSGHVVADYEFTGPNSLRMLEMMGTDHPVVASAAAPVPGGALLVSVGGPHATVWKRSGTAGFALLAQMSYPEPLTGVTLADVNGDGLPDIIATSIGHLVVWCGRSDGLFEPPQTVAATHRGLAPVVGDFNGDGRLDVAWNNSIWRNVSILLNTTPRGLPGDGDGDGVLDVKDAALALRVALGLTSVSADARERLDVWPTQRDGSWGDGRVTVQDATRIAYWVSGADD